MAFDITKHEWSDKAFRVVIDNGHDIGIHVIKNTKGLAVGWLNKSNAIAIARYFGVIDISAMQEFAAWAEARRQDFPKCTEALEAFIFMKTVLTNNMEVNGD